MQQFISVVVSKITSTKGNCIYIIFKQHNSFSLEVATFFFNTILWSSLETSTLSNVSTHVLARQLSDIKEYFFNNWIRDHFYITHLSVKGWYSKILIIPFRGRGVVLDHPYVRKTK